MDTKELMNHERDELEAKIKDLESDGSTTFWKVRVARMNLKEFDLREELIITENRIEKQEETLRKLVDELYINAGSLDDAVGTLDTLTVEACPAADLVKSQTLLTRSADSVAKITNNISNVSAQLHKLTELRGAAMLLENEIKVVEHGRTQLISEGLEEGLDK